LPLTPAADYAILRCRLLAFAFFSAAAFRDCDRPFRARHAISPPDCCAAATFFEFSFICRRLPCYLPCQRQRFRFSSRRYASLPPDALPPFQRRFAAYAAASHAAAAAAAFSFTLLRFRHFISIFSLPLISRSFLLSFSLAFADYAFTDFIDAITRRHCHIDTGFRHCHFRLPFRRID